MSYTRIYQIEEELRKIKKVNPDNIEDAKNKLLDYKNRNQVSEEDLRNTRIKFQSQLSSSPAVSNALAISAIAISLLTGAFGLVQSTDPFYQVLYSITTLLIAGIMIYFNSINSNTYKKCASYTIMIAIIDEIL
ncbi:MULTISPECIES: hypothetical protein [Paenibacillus]|uniref:hypothetical protein n=1 Tax=Paenibacillus TaxID=44249 RepID=UPI00096D3D9B|nr:hypothetical protein [Paenibacillus odorifer]OME18750.1 hypothetical protein BSK60_01545 [Paenibacillus odorifer]